MNKEEFNPFLKISKQPQPDIVDTECPICHQQATTTMILAAIPLFREIMVCSFACQHCGERNNQVQFVGKLPDFGVSLHFRCLSPEDLNRQIIRSQHCTLQIEQLELNLPPSNKAEVTTIESILLRSHQDISSSLKTNTYGKQEYSKLILFLQKLEQYSQGKHFPVTLKLRDPSGNSNIKNPFAPKLDKNMEVTHFKRTKEELIAMGYNPTNAEQQVKNQEERQPCGDKLNFVKPFEEQDFLKYEPVSFEVECEVCFMAGKMVTCRTSVPYFTDFIIMSFSCEYCGYHSTETKNSSGIGKQALVITLNVQEEADLKRDLFKSQTCFVEIPELELELDYGTLGGVLTTVEGLLQKIHDHLNDHNPFADSDKQFGSKMASFLDSLMDMRNGKRKFTLMLIDPIAQSFLQNPQAPNEDRKAKRYLRERTVEENQMIGLNDMKIENYSS